MKWGVAGHGPRRRVGDQTNTVSARTRLSTTTAGSDGEKKGCPVSRGIEEDDLRVDKIEKRADLVLYATVKCCRAVIDLGGWTAQCYKAKVGWGRLAVGASYKGTSAFSNRGNLEHGQLT